MSADLSPGRPTEQEWAEAMGRAVRAWDCCASCTGGVLRPLIARVEEAAKTEGMAAVAGPVLALADEIHAGGCHYRHQQGEIDECNSCTAHRFETALPTDATEALLDVWAQVDDTALARLKALRQAEALRDAADWIDSTRSQKGIASQALDPGKAFAVDVLRDRIAREAQQDGGSRG